MSNRDHSPIKNKTIPINIIKIENGFILLIFLPPHIKVIKTEPIKRQYYKTEYDLIIPQYGIWFYFMVLKVHSITRNLP
jgi:hypothetical protein